MKFTKPQLREVIRKIVKRHLNEVYGTSAYETMLNIKDLYLADFGVLDKIGPELYQKILDFRSQASDFDQFKKLVQGMPPEMAKKFWIGEMGKLDSVKKLLTRQKEWEDLKDRFKEVDATTEADRAYGRKRKKIIDTKTGEVLGFETDKKGSLGS